MTSKIPCDRPVNSVTGKICVLQKKMFARVFGWYEEFLDKESLIKPMIIYNGSHPVHPTKETDDVAKEELYLLSKNAAITAKTNMKFFVADATKKSKRVSIVSSKDKVIIVRKSDYDTDQLLQWIGLSYIVGNHWLLNTKAKVSMYSSKMKLEHEFTVFNWNSLFDFMNSYLQNYYESKTSYKNPVNAFKEAFLNTPEIEQQRIEKLEKPYVRYFAEEIAAEEEQKDASTVTPAALPDNPVVKTESTFQNISDSIKQESGSFICDVKREDGTTTKAELKVTGEYLIFENKAYVQERGNNWIHFTPVGKPDKITLGCIKAEEQKEYVKTEAIIPISSKSEDNAVDVKFFDVDFKSEDKKFTFKLGGIDFRLGKMLSGNVYNGEEDSVDSIKHRYILDGKIGTDLKQNITIRGLIIKEDGFETKRPEIIKVNGSIRNIGELLDGTKYEIL